MFDKEKLLKIIESKIKGQGNQIDTANVLPTILVDIVEAMAETMTNADTAVGVTGNLADLETDHKSDIVSAINELFGVLETPEYQISMLQSNAERKAIYDEIVKHPPLAKNVVFYNVSDAMYYKVNGYNLINNVLYLHTIMQGQNNTLRSIMVNIGSNGSISVI